MKRIRTEGLLTGVILAGGQGTRLRPFTITIPKPLLPVGDIPILEVVIRQMIGAGIKHIVLALGHMAPLFMGLIGDGSRWGVRIEYLIEDEHLGTAGILRSIAATQGELLVMNGDVLTTLDYSGLIQAHRSTGAWATIALSHRKVEIGYGVVEAKNGFLESYREKPTISYDVSMGVNVITAEALSLVPASGRFDMPELLMAIKRAGRAVACWSTDCYWKDIGLFDDYQKASADFVENPSRFLNGKNEKNCAHHGC